jgi:hypothetical protein
MSVLITLHGALYWAAPELGYVLHRPPSRYDTPARYLREAAATAELQDRTTWLEPLVNGLQFEARVWQRHPTDDRIACAVRELRAWCRSRRCHASVFTASTGRQLLVLSQRRGGPYSFALAFAQQKHDRTPSTHCYDFAGFGEVTVFLPDAPMDVHYAGHCFPAGTLVDPRHPAYVARAHRALEREARRAVGRALRRIGGGT